MKLLGGMTPAAFVRRHWQKRPLLVRQAIPDFRGFVSRAQLLAMAARTDVASRLVLEHPGRRRDRWEVHDGPFPDLDPARLPPTHWTMLVHGIENLVPDGWELLRRFSFLPAARTDDLMISTAATGGSVGPHVDRYDVFLLQGPGRRRWQLGGKRSVGDQPSILSDFVPEQDWVLEPGDMLYLPPGIAHFGVALEPCLTYSIGFVAPTHLGLVRNFLGYLERKLTPGIDPERIYSDPDLVLQRDPVVLGQQMIDAAGAVVSRIRWQRGDVEEFVGRLLTGPKPLVVFQPPRRAMTPAAFAHRLARAGTLRLALPTRGLVRGRRVFVNGEMLVVDARTRALFQRLFATRALALPLAVTATARALLHQLHGAGFVQFDRKID